MLKTCFFCGNTYETTAAERARPKPIEIQHYVNGVQTTDKVVPYDDAFFEITGGPRKGNLVHRWSIATNKVI